jgi:holin-like protein
MRLLSQLAIVMAIGFSGLAISSVLPFPLPGSIIGMILLLLLLCFKLLKMKHIQDVGGFFLRNMGVFFVPPCVGIIEYFGLLQDKLFAFILISIISTLLTFLATAAAVTLVIGLQRKLSKKETV